MNKSIFDIIRSGQKFMNLWPKRPELVNYFAEYRSVVVSRYVCHTMPALAIFVMVIQLYLAGFEQLSQALVYGIFILSLPVQALLLLGKKAQQELPPALASWYREGVSKLKEQGSTKRITEQINKQNIQLSMKRPSYMELALLLNLIYQNRNAH
jgi:uncharacterized membrane protein YfbV (UPF0208 family)